MILLLLAGPTALLSLVIWIVVALIIMGVLFWAVNKLSAAFGIPDPIRTVVIVLLVLVCLVVIVSMVFGGGGELPSLR